MSLSETIRKMNELKLFGMSKSIEERELSGRKDLSGEELLGLAVDDEYLHRKNNRLQRLLQKAKLKHSQACFEDIDYHHPRALEKSAMLNLQSTEWIESSRTVLLTGPTGVGKSYLACALGQWACRQGYPTFYSRWPRLLGDLYASRGEGAYLKHLDRLAKVKVLVIDDFGLHTLNDQERKDFLEIIEDRHMTGSTVITSQLPIKDWHEHIGEPTIADAILDRLLHVAYKIELKGDTMRRGKEKVRSAKD